MLVGKKSPVTILTVSREKMQLNDFNRLVNTSCLRTVEAVFKMKATLFILLSCIFIFACEKTKVTVWDINFTFNEGELENETSISQW